MTLSGGHEIQESEEGEADLHKHYKNCTKNPGHKQFVPVDHFDINHLPEGYHDKLIVDYIKATADLTVRVAGTKISPKRPEFKPHTEIPYPFYDKRGRDVKTFGTGMVMYEKNEQEEETCSCKKCQKSDTPSIEWGEVQIFTARHVVFDDFEAGHTICRLFFDREDSPLVTLDGWMRDEESIEHDWCKLSCVTCDQDLLDKLDKTTKLFAVLWRKLYDKYTISKDKLTWMVSHPHGCPKQISVGKWIDRKELKNNMTWYTYSTCTCPGSSGAHVHPLGHVGCYLYDLHVHSGVYEGKNYSGAGEDLMYVTSFLRGKN